MTSEPNSRQRGFGPSRAQVLEHLRSTGAAEPVAAVATAVGLHENTARFHLDALIESGLVHRQVESRRQPGRPRVLYQADPVPNPQRFYELAAVMVRHFAGPMVDRGIRAESAGLAWGAELRAGLPKEPGEALSRLVGCLTSLGCRPELVDGTTPTIGVRPCPYSDLSQDHPDTVCRVHLGVMRGLLADADPWEVTALEPYVTPELCVVRLAPKEAVS